MFGSKRKSTLEEAEPPAAPYAERRREELSQEIQRLKSALGELSHREAMFASKYFIMVDGARAWRLSEIGDRAKLEEELRELRRERDELLGRWHAALHEHANLVSRK